ncbi:VOC family protein [Salinibacterium sp. GXW1014]|uniref:VOC family protein n=1 Tax=Salinibacterium sp. GXW1014 TaxID=3377838 RepID=UPI00383BF172
MVAKGTVSELGYVSLRTTDLKASIEYAENFLGLRVTEATSTKAYLAAQETHHEIVYTQSDENGTDHMGVLVPNGEELAAVREKVARRGFKVITENPFETHAEAGFAFVDHEGYTWNVYQEADRYDIRVGFTNVDRFGHINLKVRDSITYRDFLIDVFDLKVSDQIGEDIAFFLRCNADHHGIAIMKRDDVALHHHAWQVQSIADLGRLGDRLIRAGSRLVWGPVRHGAGHNIAAYYLEPAGGIVEVYADMEQIYDPERGVKYWDPEDLSWINQWDGQIPEMLQYGFAPTTR